ncbi:MAG: type III-B CRISPR module-associated Cmr3 family protein [Thermofilaceae archaeon]|nr:type III-B CRISPR module-associated Cmr3 family protein [Thermofilaceae archaeon]
MKALEIYQVKIKPLEPLMLRGPGEFDPSTRGVTAAALSQTWPSPSTLTGLLISNLITSPQPRSRTWSEYLNTALKALQAAGLEWVRGPYLIHEGSVHVPLWTREGILLASWSSIERRLDEVVERLNSGDVDEVLEKIEKDTGRRATPRLHERVGIALAAREGSKKVKEGYLYSATYVAFRHACFTIEVKATSSITTLNKAAAQLGGEERIARLEVLSTSEVGEHFLCKKLARFGGGCVLLLSPFVLPPDVTEIVEEGGKIYVKDEEGNHAIELLHGVVDVRGLGFSLADRSRKPIYPLIREGSIIRIERCYASAQTLGAFAGLPKQTPFLEYLGRFGFGSFLPLT